MHIFTHQPQLLKPYLHGLHGDQVAAGKGSQAVFVRLAGQELFGHQNIKY